MSTIAIRNHPNAVVGQLRIDPTDTTQVPAATDIGTDTELDLVSTVWGIDYNGNSTAATPQFRIVDIDTIRNEWHVVIEPVGIATVYQWLDAPV